ncbi:MAG: FkbM family methyltransferase [Myxococcales bacterium]|nr:FkbM family methyltransferase [Myxococcales bacterium]
MMKVAISRLGFSVARRPYSRVEGFFGLKSLEVNTVLDIGANRGQFARIILTVFPEAQLYCFEPLPQVFEQLQQWAGEQARVQAMNVALGDECGSVDMFMHSNFTPSSSLLATTRALEETYPQVKEHRPQPVELRRLDDIASELALVPPILAKLDVQGYEDRVIRGGLETLERCAACIVETSIEGFYENQASFHDIYLLLSEAGFQYAGNLEQTYGADGRVLSLDAVFRRREEG